MLEFNVPASAPPSMLPTVHGSTYWKLNTRAVTFEDYLPNILDVWEVLLSKEADYDDVVDWWDSCAKPRLVELYMQAQKHFF